MKRRTIPVYERHAEKVFFAVCIAALLGVVFWQAAGTLTVDEYGSDVPLVDVGGEIDRRSRTLARALTPSVDDDPPEVPAPAAMLEAFRASLGSSPEPVSADGLASSWSNLPDVLGGASGSISSVESSEYAFYEPPAPDQPVPMIFEGALLSDELSQNQGLSAYVPAREPYDLRGVSVEARFDVAALIAGLRAEPEDPGQAPMLEQWWRSSLVILDVQLERQVLGSDGEWGDAVLVESMPGRMSLRDSISSISSPAALGELAGEARRSQGEIRRPRMYQMVSGLAWERPILAADAPDWTERRREAQQKLGRLNSLQRQRDSVQQRIQNAGRNPRDGGGGRPDREGGGGRTPGPDRGNNQQRDGLQQQLDRLDREIVELELEINDLGFVIGVDGALERAEAVRRAQDPSDTRDPAEATATVDLTSPALDEIVLLQHDIGAPRGAQVRYRMRLILPNPYHGRAKVLADSQQSLADPPVVATPYSEWSEPMAVMLDEYFFVTSVNLQTGGGPFGGGGLIGGNSTAQFELFSFYDGYWRTGTARLEIGDAVRGELLVETEVEAAEEPDQTPGRRPVPPGVRPGGPQVPPGVRPGGGVPGVGGEEQRRGEPEGRPAAARQAAESVEESRPFEADAVLIDLVQKDQDSRWVWLAPKSGTALERRDTQAERTSRLRAELGGRSELSLPARRFEGDDAVGDASP